jgi:subtilisin family serine protease
MAAAIGLAASLGAAVPALAQNAPYANDRVLVRFAPAAGAATRSSARAAARADLRESYRVVPGLELLKVRSGRTVEQAIAALRRNPNVLYAEPDYLVRPAVQPNEPEYYHLWGLHNIRAPAAWDITTGSDSVVVAVIDSGIDIDHPDLAQNIWTNPGEVAGNRIDDDHNGYVDDVHGWDFIGNDNDPSDVLGHGTHAAGIIGARGNNSLGVVGVNWRVKLVPLKFISDSGFGSTSNAIRAFQYARQNGIRISNNSWGSPGFSQAMYDAVKSLQAAGHLAVCAAGNETSNNDLTPLYPGSFDLDNVISVTSITSSESMSDFSNYGPTSVDLGAPGASILSTAPDNQYDYASGTSMAAPFVTGVAALVASKNPTWTHSRLRAAILDTVRPIPALSGKTVTGGTLDLYAALRSSVVLPTYTLSPTALEFDRQTPVGDTSAPQTVTLTNTSTVPLPIRNVALGNSNSEQFGFTHDCGASVAAGASCALSVVFKPRDGGAMKATLHIAVGGGADSTSVTLVGTALTPFYTFAPAKLDFGELVAGTTSAPQTVTLTNTGTLVLPIDRIQWWNGWNFDLTQTCGAIWLERSVLKGGSLAPGESCTFSVVFTPGSGGTEWGTLFILGGNHASGNSVSLVGKAVAAQFKRAPTQLVFGEQVVGGASPAQTVTVTNTGTLPVPINSITVTTSQFGLTHTCGSSLPAGSSCTISTTFKPTLAGTQKASLRIWGGSGAGEQAVGLTGTALAQAGEPPGSLTVPVADPDGRYLVGWRAAATADATYVLEEATDPSFTSELRTVYEGPNLSAEIDGRTTGVTYYYRVTTTQNGSFGAWVNGRNGCLVTNRRGARLQLITLPDVNSSGSQDLAVLRTQARTVEIKDGWFGAGIGTLTFLDTDFSALAAKGLPDADGDGSPELALLALRNSDGRGIVEIRELTGSDPARQIWLASGHSPIAIAVIDEDTDGDGAPELAVLSVRDNDARIVVQVLNASGNTIPRLLAGPAGYAPRDLSVVPDADHDGTANVAVLSTHVLDPRMLAQVRDVGGAVMPISMWFARNHTAIDLASLPDTDADGVAEIAVLSTQDSDGRTLVAMKNALGSGANEQALWVPPGYQALGIESSSPAPGTTMPQVAILLQRNTDGRSLVFVRDAIGYANPRTLLYPIGYTAHDFAILADVDGSGSEEAAVLLTRDSDGRVLVQRKNIYSFPWPTNYWFDQ